MAVKQPTIAKEASGTRLRLGDTFGKIHTKGHPRVPGTITRTTGETWISLSWIADGIEIVPPVPFLVTPNLNGFMKS